MQLHKPRTLPSLEYELHRQLRRARAADLEQRIEAASLPARAERRPEHLGRLPEQRRRHVVDRRAEIRVVEDVEEVGAGLERKALMKIELPRSVRSTSVAPNPLRTLRPRLPWTAPTGL